MARSDCGAVDGADARAVLAVWGVRKERAVLALTHTCSSGSFVIDRKGSVGFAPMASIVVDRERLVVAPWYEKCCGFRKVLVVGAAMFALWVLSA
jgi:hypothetical protein